MNLLIPNITWLSAYNVARCLRPYCRQLVVTVTPLLRPAALSSPRLTRLIYSNLSPLFDYVYTVLVPAKPDEEEAYVGQMLDICRRHEIDTLFPTGDAEIKIISKHREAFSAAGVNAVVSPFEALEKAFDKFTVASLAQEVGFPCPRTIRVEGPEQAEDAAAELGFPLVIKATFSRGSYGVRLARKATDIYTQLDDLKDEGALMFQEYIPGNRERSLNVVLDPEGRGVLSFTLRKLHYLKPSMSTVIEVIESPPEMPKAVELLRRLGVYGFCAVQTKIDERDGSYKLIEVNPRFGSNARIILRLGQNLPLDWVRMSRGKQVNLQSYPVGLRGVSPYEDFLAFCLFLSLKARGLFGKGDAQTETNPVPPLTTMLRSYARIYGGRYVLDDTASALFDDPFMVLHHYAWLTKSLLNLPKHWHFFIPWGEVE